MRVYILLCVSISTSSSASSSISIHPPPATICSQLFSEGWPSQKIEIEVSETLPGPLVPAILRATVWHVESWGREVRRRSGRSRFCEVWSSSSDPFYMEKCLHAKGVRTGVQTSQNRDLLDLLWTSRPHDSMCHIVARRIVRTRGPEEVREISIL